MPREELVHHGAAFAEPMLNTASIINVENRNSEVMKQPAL